MKVLMCPPTYFGVEYEINPWMKTENQPDRALAHEQWDALRETYRSLGVEVATMDGVPGLPDIVFTANAAVVWNGRAIISRFATPERQPEAQYFDEYFYGQPFEVGRPSATHEGAGDFLFLGDRLFAGHGFRTSFDSHRHIAAVLEVREYHSLELVDPRFYHLDTCFCPLNETTALAYLPAFTQAAQYTLRHEVPTLIEVTEAEALAFACNAMPVGNTVVEAKLPVNHEMTVEQNEPSQLRDVLDGLGFSVIELDMSEFMKAGGAVRCLTLPLDLGDKNG